MLLAPDANTANLDPFFDEPTVIMTCDVIEPSDGKGYDRDPRSIAKRAEAYLKLPAWATPPTLVRNRNSSFFDSIRFGADMSGCFIGNRIEEGAWSSSRNTKTATPATVRA